MRSARLFTGLIHPRRAAVLVPTGTSARVSLGLSRNTSVSVGVCGLAIHKEGADASCWVSGYLSISDRCEPVEYREKKGGDYPDHIFVVGGSACSDWKAYVTWEQA